MNTELVDGSLESLARLTFYRTWKDENGHRILEGTNNHCERSIGSWIKERYRSMRGYKLEQSALNVSRLIALAGSRLSRELNLAELMASFALETAYSLHVFHFV